MIVNFSLVNELFRGFYIQRWNDRIRPMELTEMDKHAHKMIIAYVLGKYEEMNGNLINWQKIIKAGIFELLRRIIISDIKSPIFRRIKQDKEVFNKLNEYAYNSIKDKIDDKNLKREFREHLFMEPEQQELNYRILEASHIYASYWEFKIIKASNPESFQNEMIEKELLNDIDKYRDITGINKLLKKHTISNFIDLIGQMRFQVRWAQTPRIPRTSVLGHSLFVACVSYYFALENNACPKRLYNDFYGGLFHDMPEAVTRDILSPVKESSEEFRSLLAELEEVLVDEQIKPLIEPEWENEIKFFTRQEFDNKVFDNGKLNSDLTIDDINEKYNADKYTPYDGQAVRAADRLAAFLEAWNSCNSGIKSEELIMAVKKIKDNMKNRKVGKVDLSSIYYEFNTFW